MSITASAVVSFRARPRSTAITSRRSSSHTGDDPSHSGVGGPPPDGAMITLPPAVKAIRVPSGDDLRAAVLPEGGKRSTGGQAHRVPTIDLDRPHVRRVAVEGEGDERPVG